MRSGVSLGKPYPATTPADPTHRFTYADLSSVARDEHGEALLSTEHGHFDYLLEGLGLGGEPATIYVPVTRALALVTALDKWRGDFYGPLAEHVLTAHASAAEFTSFLEGRHGFILNLRAGESKRRDDVTLERIARNGLVESN